MQRRFRMVWIGILIATLLQVAPAAALDEDASRPGSVPVLIDAWILRPLGFAMMVEGFVRFAVMAPVVAITRPTDFGKVWHESVVEAARYTFVDPLGFHPQD